MKGKAQASTTPFFFHLLLFIAARVFILYARSFGAVVRSLSDSLFLLCSFLCRWQLALYSQTPPN